MSNLLCGVLAVVLLILPLNAEGGEVKIICDRSAPDTVDAYRPDARCIYAAVALPKSDGNRGFFYKEVRRTLKKVTAFSRYGSRLIISMADGSSVELSVPWGANHRSWNRRYPGRTDIQVYFLSWTKNRRIKVFVPLPHQSAFWEAAEGTRDGKLVIR